MAKTYSVFKDTWVIGLVALLLLTVGGSVVIHEVTPQGITNSYVVSSEGATMFGDLSVGLFWDSYRTQPVDNIDWGVMETGTNKSVTIYFANYELRPVHISGVSLLNSTPANFISLHNYQVELVQIPALRVVPFNLSIVIDEFDYNITRFDDIISLAFSDVVETIDLLVENFNTDPMWTTLNGDWQVINGEMVGNGISAGIIDIVNLDFTTPESFTVDVNAYMDSAGTPEAQVILKYLDESNYYFVGIGGWGHLGSIAMVQNGIGTLLASTSDTNHESIQSDRWYDIQIMVTGDTIMLYVDGVLQCQTTNSEIQGNRIGLRSWNSLVKYDNLKVVK